ncbi:MAG: acyltransferase [Planctomycetota bacterium]
MADYFVHPTSIVEENVEIGPRTRIWHFCHVVGPCSIGADCNIGQNVFIARNVQIGRNVKIQNNVSVYEGVILEDDVFCGPSMVFTNVMNPRAFVSRKDEYRQTRVKKGATIGANATVVCGVTIGAFAFVGAGAVVTRDVPDFALAYGNPARREGWVCRCGEKLDIAEDAGKCRRCSMEYEMSGERLRPKDHK